MKPGSSLVGHLALLGLASLITLPAYHLTAKASVGGPAPQGRAVEATAREGQHDLSRLQLLHRTLYFVDDKYVEPERIDPEAMFDGALDAVERRVPEVLFRREPGSRQLHISVGEHVTVLELAAIDSTRALVAQLQRVAVVLQDRLSEEVPGAEVEYAFINGVLGTLDPHSVLLPPEASREMDVDNAGSFGGLGININNPGGRLTIAQPMPDMPAARAGLRAGDQIVRIDGESTVNMDLDEAVLRLRGPVGEPVVLTIRREDWGEDRDVTVVRDTIRINEVKGELLEGGVGYARIHNFHATVSTDLVNLLARLRRENGGQELHGLVLDLRGNPGGFLHQAIEVSDLFLSSGGIVSTVERGERRVEDRMASRLGTQPDYPVVVLVDASSASASEIVAGALHDNGRAVVVGERTFGKGSVQNLYKNDDESQLKLTVAKYLTPDERSIQSVGIPADIRLEPAVVATRVDEDSGLARPIVAMRFREHVTREADLDHHMEWSDGRAGQSVYELRYLRELPKPEVSEPDPGEDWEVRFCRDLLVASPATASRAEVLASVGAVIANTQRQEDLRIHEAFQRLGVDWTPGPQPASPQLAVTLDAGPDGVLRAGESQAEDLVVRVTNTGDAPVHQLMAVADSNLEWLDHSEFFFGRLDPGETRSWAVPVRLPEGYRAERGALTLSLQGGDRSPMGTSVHAVRVEGQELPALRWTWAVTDAGEGTRGDGDGVIEPGEVVALDLELTNVGPGLSPAPFVRLKNQAGRALDLQTGTAELEPLAPGATASTRFLFKVMGGQPELPVELRVGDQLRYDHAAVHQAGFYDQLALAQPLRVPVGGRGPTGDGDAPAVEVTRGPSLEVQDARQVLSGMATDPDGVRDVLIYHVSEAEQDKVYFGAGGAGAKALPFSAELRLDPGENLFVIMVRDSEGVASVRSVQTWLDLPEPGGATASRPE